MSGTPKTELHKKRIARSVKRTLRKKNARIREALKLLDASERSGVVVQLPRMGDRA